MPERSVVVGLQRAASGVRTEARKRRGGTQVRYRSGQGPNSLQDKRSGRSMPSRQRSRRIRRSGVAGRCAASSCKHRKHSRRGERSVERQAGRGEDACDRCRRSELVTPVVAGVGLGVAGSCSDGCIAVGQGVAALVAIGGGTDGEPGQGSRSSSPGGEVRHGGGGRTRRCAVAIVMVMVIFGSGGARSDTRTGAALGDGGMRLGRGSAFAEGGHSTATIRLWLAGGQSGRLAEAGDHDRRSVPIALIVGSAGLATLGRSGAAAPMSGEASWRSSPSATALTPSTRMGRAVRLGEVNCGTMSTAAVVGVSSPSSSPRSSSPAQAGARAVHARAAARRASGDGAQRRAGREARSDVGWAATAASASAACAKRGGTD